MCSWTDVAKSPRYTFLQTSPNRKLLPCVAYCISNSCQPQLSVVTKKTPFWTDSTTVLTWLQSELCKLKVLASTRIFWDPRTYRSTKASLETKAPTSNVLAHSFVKLYPHHWKNSWLLSKLSSTTIHQCSPLWWIMGERSDALKLNTTPGAQTVKQSSLK